MNIFLIIGTILVCLWIILTIKANREIVESGDWNKDLVKVGIYLLKLTNYSYTRKYDFLILKQAKIIYGEKDYRERVEINYANRIFITYIFAVLALLVYPMSQEPVFSFLFIFAIIIANLYFDDQIKNTYKKRDESLMNDFPNALSKLTLLINAGMTINEAWESVAYGKEGMLYDEMRITCLQIRNDENHIDAYTSFGLRCGNHKIRKASATIAQTISKGSSEVVDILLELSNDMWDEKKHLVKRKGEKASAKLVMPISLMFLGIMLMVIIPLVANMNI